MHSFPPHVKDSTSTMSGTTKPTDAWRASWTGITVGVKNALQPSLNPTELYLRHRPYRSHSLFFHRSYTVSKIGTSAIGFHPLSRLPSQIFSFVFVQYIYSLTCMLVYHRNY